MGVRLTKVADDGEIYFVPDENESLKNAPSFIMEDEFPEIRITNEDYDANIIIADLNKQLNQKEKELSSKEIYPTTIQTEVNKAETSSGKKTIFFLISAILIAIIIVIILLIINVFKDNDGTVIINNQTINQNNIDINSAIQFTDVDIAIDNNIESETEAMIAETSLPSLTWAIPTTVLETVIETELQSETSATVPETDLITDMQTSATSEAVAKLDISNYVDEVLVIPEGTTTISWGEYCDRDDITSLVIPEGVTCICGNAFQNCDNLESVIIPEGVTEIGEGAFRYCYNLKEIVIPKSVIKIGTDAFNDCLSLNYVTILNDNTDIGVRAFGRTPWASMKYHAKFEKANDGYILTQCKSAYGNIIIPEGVTKIGDNAFSSEYLYSITLPSSVAEIGDNAFNNCNNLTDIIIPESVTKIGESAFPWNWKNAQNQPVIINNILIYYNSKHTSENVTLPDGITEISDKAFEGNENIVNITIPESVTKIGYAAFSKCNNLKAVILEGDFEDIEFSSYVFYNCSNLKEVICNGENIITKIKLQ